MKGGTGGLGLVNIVGVSGGGNEGFLKKGNREMRSKGVGVKSGTIILPEGEADARREVRLGVGGAP